MKKIFIKGFVAAIIVLVSFSGGTAQVFAHYDGGYTEGYGVSSEPYITGGSYSEGYGVSSQPYITGGSYSEGYGVSSEPYITGGSYSEGYGVSSEPYITGGSYTSGYSEPYITGGSYTAGYSEPYVTGGYYDSGYTSSYTTPSYSYTTPTYSNSTYGYTNYTYPTYTYTQPTYVNPVTPVTPIYTCNGVVSHNPCAPTNPCPAGGYVRLANGSCGCPAGTTPAMPDGCRPITTGGMCPMDAHTCADGSTVGRTGPNCQFVCPVPAPVVPVTPVTRCSDGTLPSPTTGCTRTTVVPTNNNTICSDGSYPNPVTGCTRVTVVATTNTQVCWDGSTLPLYSQCPSQYKVCANGTSIPVNQTCYVGNTYVPYVPPQTIKFNNVITSVATEITLTSARCNGIGLIASGANSTGWFEYGETANLGRETGKANIGSSPTAPFSNVLANLKPTTKYYCRAVMQNQYGIVKGEIVAFTTKAKAVSYVKTVTKTTTKVSTSKVPTKTNQVVCTDGTVSTINSKGAADIINDGGKLVSLQIEKISGNFSAGSVVSYKLTLKNLSDERLDNVTAKVTIPQEITITNASAGNYDPVTHILTVTNIPLAAYGEATINWTGTVDKNASLGKSTVTTAYSNYTVPGSTVQDEVTAYVVGSVVPGTDVKSDTGSKTVIGATNDRGFLPNSLVEWLALIAILFIIFILGRSVYTSYSSNKKGTH